MSDDEDGGFPKTGAGVGENDAATGPGTEDDAGEGLPAPSNVREASDGGKLREPAAPHNGAQNMNSTYPLVIRGQRDQKSILLHWTRPTLVDLTRQPFRWKIYLLHPGVP